MIGLARLHSQLCLQALKAHEKPLFAIGMLCRRAGVEARGCPAVSHLPSPRPLSSKSPHGFTLASLLRNSRRVLCCSTSDAPERRDGTPATSSSAAGAGMQLSRRTLKGRRPGARATTQLKKTSTLCWVNQQLVVLFDPKRRRMVYVLELKDAGDLAMKQLEAVVEASEALAAFFAEPEPDRFRPHTDVVSTSYSTYTLAIPVPPPPGYTSFPEPEPDKDGELPGAGRAGWLFLRPRGSRKTSFMHSLRSLVRSRGAEWPERRSSPSAPAPFSLRPPLRDFVLGVEDARREGVYLSEDLLVVQNKHLDSAPEQQPNLDKFNLDIKLGYEPDDYTVFVHTQHEAVAKHQHLEHCLHMESDYLRSMARLEEHWEGPTVLDKDWGEVQRANTTTGRAKLAGAEEGQEGSGPEGRAGVSGAGSGEGGRQGAGPGVEGSAAAAAEVSSGGDQEAEEGPRGSADGTDGREESGMQHKLLARPVRRGQAGPRIGQGGSNPQPGSSRWASGGSAAGQGSEQEGWEAASRASEPSPNLDRDLEVVEQLLGRTLSDVADLKAAFAQGGIDLSSGLPLLSLLLKQSLEAIMAGRASGSESSSGVGFGAGEQEGRAGSGSRSSSSGGGGSGGSEPDGRRGRKRRLKLPQSVVKLASSSLFARKNSSSSSSSSGGTDGDEGQAGSASRMEAAVSECMRLLRPPPGPDNRYICNRDIMLVVGDDGLLGKLASSWDQSERRLMLTPS